MNTVIREISVDMTSCISHTEKGDLLEAYLCHQQQNSIENKRYEKLTHPTN